MKTIAIGMCAAAVLVAVAAHAATPEQRSGFVVRRIEHRLGMTEPQRDQVKAILMAERPKIQALAVRVRTENAELGKHDGFDESYVRSFAEQHAGTMTEVLVEREKVRIELMGVLTPEQKGKLAAMRAERAERLEERLAGMGAE